MAKEKDAWTRFREKEQEREREEALKARDSVAPNRSGGSLFSDSTSEIAAPNATALGHLVHRGENLLEQIQSLYNMYVAGQERTLPVAQRKQLEDLAAQIGIAAKPSVADRFRASQFNSKMTAYKDKWDRLAKDLEAGRVVRKKTQSRSSA